MRLSFGAIPSFDMSGIFRYYLSTKVPPFTFKKKTFVLLCVRYEGFLIKLLEKLITVAIVREILNKNR